MRDGWEGTEGYIMKKQIADIFIELGNLGVSPIKTYNIMKDFIVITKEDLEPIKKCFLVRLDGDIKFLFSEGPEKAFYNVDNELDLEILYIIKINVWEMLINSLDSREESLPF